MPTQAQVERAKTLQATGVTIPRIAKEFGVCTRTISRWLRREDPPAIAEELERFRSDNREKFVNDAWDNIHELNRLMKERIAEGGSAFKNPKEIAVCLGVSFDKVTALERPEATKGGGGGVVINILPPAQDGNTTTRIIADTVPVPDEPGEVFRDGSGSGSGENLLALPPGREDRPGKPGVPRDDSGIDLSEPGRLCDPDADTGTLGEDGGS